MPLLKMDMPFIAKKAVSKGSVSLFYFNKKIKFNVLLAVSPLTYSQQYACSGHKQSPQCSLWCIVTGSTGAGVKDCVCESM